MSVWVRYSLVPAVYPGKIIAPYNYSRNIPGNDPNHDLNYSPVSINRKFRETASSLEHNTFPGLHQLVVMNS